MISSFEIDIYYDHYIKFINIILFNYQKKFFMFLLVFPKHFSIVEHLAQI